MKINRLYKMTIIVRSTTVIGMLFLIIGCTRDSTSKRNDNVNQLDKASIYSDIMHIESENENIDEAVNKLAEEGTPLIQNPFDELNESLQNGETVYFEHFSIVPQVYTAEIEERKLGSQGGHVGLVSIDYPLFASELIDEVDINELIYNARNREYFRLLNLFEERDFSGTFSIRQTYRIEYISNEIVSIYFFGDSGSLGTIPSRFSHAIIVNLRTLELLTYADFTTFEEIKEAINVGNFRLIGENNGFDVMRMVQRTLALESYHHFYLSYLSELCIDIDISYRSYRSGPIAVCMILHWR